MVIIIRLTSANIRVCFSTWPPGGIMVKVLTLLTVVPNCIVLAHTSTMHLGAKTQREVEIKRSKIEKETKPCYHKALLEARSY